MQPLDEEMLTNLAKEPAVIEGDTSLLIDILLGVGYLRSIDLNPTMKNIPKTFSLTFPAFLALEILKADKVRQYLDR